MSFGRLLRRRLGPLGGLAPRPSRVGRPPAEALWFRRAVGLEIETRPFDKPGRFELSGPHGQPSIPLDESEMSALTGLHRWRPAEQTGVKPSVLERWIEADLVYWAREDPGVHLPPTRLEDREGPVARRREVWPTPAIETAVAIAPLPFMPRGADLEGAQMVGLRLATLERGHEILGLTILGDATLGRELRDLLPLLSGRMTRRELVDAAPRESRKQRSRLLDTLERCGALQSTSKPPRLSASTRPRATWLGHAAVLLESEGSALLVDPLFHAASEPSADAHPRPDPRSLPPLEAVLVTHGDNDHLSPNALAQIAPSTPVIIPRVPEPRAPHQVDIEGVLRLLGFSDIRPLDPFEATEVGPFVVHGLPFDGEDWGLQQAQLTYLVESRGLSVFFSADSLGPAETYRWLADRPGSVDLAFMGISGASEALVAPPGLGYGNFYAPWIPAARRNEFVHHTAGPAASAAFCEVFEPRYACGYAAGGTPYIRTEYPDRGTQADFARALEGQRTKACTLEVGVPLELSELD